MSDNNRAGSQSENAGARPLTAETAGDFKKGDYVLFGTGKGDDNGKCPPLEWQVLEASPENGLLLLSRYIHEERPFHKTASGSVTWGTSDLRKWLNGVFFRGAFSKEEQKLIRVSRILNDNGSFFGPAKPEFTADRIFCLSLAEVRKYLPNARDRVGHKASLSANMRGHDRCRWWLRTLGEFEKGPVKVMNADEGGLSNIEGQCNFVRGARPALWVNPAGKPETKDTEPALRNEPFQPFSCGDAVCQTERDFLRYLFVNADFGIKALKDGVLTAHYYRFNDSRGLLCSVYEERLRLCAKADIYAMSRIYTSFITGVSGGLEVLFPDSRDLGELLLETGIKLRLQSFKPSRKSASKKSPITPLKILIETEELYDYAYKKLPEDACGEFLGNLEAVWFECRLEHYTDAELALYAGYSLTDIRKMVFNGKVYDSPEDFAREMTNLHDRDSDEFDRIIGSDAGSLGFLSDCLPDQKSRDAIREVCLLWNPDFFAADEY